MNSLFDDKLTGFCVANHLPLQYLHTEDLLLGVAASAMKLLGSARKSLY